ncbi:establishment of sister chromatid cohesion N-acetyltransferase 1 [Cricetulus griseus]
MSIQEKSKENSSEVTKEIEDENLELEIQGSQNSLAKRPGSKEAEKALLRSSNKSKINQPELGTRMSTRSGSAADKNATKSINKNMIPVKGQSQESTKRKRLCQEKLALGTFRGNDQCTRRSKRLQQLTECSVRSLRSRGIHSQTQAVKQSLQPARREQCNSPQNKSSKVTVNQKHVKRKVLEIKSDCKEDRNPVTNEVVNSPKGKKRKVQHQTSSTCGSQCIQGSEKCFQKTTRKEEAKPVPETSEIRKLKAAISVVSKKNEPRKAAHTQVNNSTKSPQIPQPLVPEQSIDHELEQAGKSKRGSILQLCEEIAGEIESDTVEVKKESSHVENVEERPTEVKSEGTDGSAPKPLHSVLSSEASINSKHRAIPPNHSQLKCNSHLEITIPKALKLKESEKVDEKQLVIDAGHKRFGAVSCNICGMLYTASNPEDETQHLLFHNQFISAVKYVGWKKERILAEYPDGRIIMVLPEDPKYALKKVDEIREMVDNDLGFQQAPLMCYSRTKTLLFISNDKKVVGCLIAEHIQWVSDF